MSQCNCTSDCPSRQGCVEAALLGITMALGILAFLWDMTDGEQLKKDHKVLKNQVYLLEHRVHQLETKR